MKEKWADPNSIFRSEVFTEKIQKALNLRPNKCEIGILKILESKHPSNYIYTGDFSFWIGGKNPDFINFEDKKIIEFFGEHWHEKEDEKDRKRIFKENGYKTLIIWEKELRDLDKLTKKIQRFEEK